MRAFRLPASLPRSHDTHHHRWLRAGARLRRGSSWRHLLVWHRPGVTPAGDECGVDRRSDDRPHPATAPEPPP